MTEMPYTDADVELVAGWFRRWLGASTIRQRDRDCAVEILSALAVAGRLARPVPAITDEQMRGALATATATGPSTRRARRAAATGGGPCGTCGKPFYTHVCLSCSPDAQTPGPGCHNCRQTGMDQTPCLPLPTSRWEVQL